MKTETKSPLRAPLLNLPGQSLDAKLFDEWADGILQPIVIAVLVWSYVLLSWLYRWLGVTPDIWMLTVSAIVVTLWAWWKVKNALVAAEHLKLGRDGERWVAQYLEGMRAHDFFVYHDVPNRDGNIDHVLIGPRGVYSIETKTLSKPERGECKIQVSQERVSANGRTMERNPIPQAKAQAGWLNSYFAEAGFRVSTRAVVLFPGWFVERHDRDVIGAWVLEPKALESFILHERETIPPEQVRALSLALANYIRSQAKI